MNETTKRRPDELAAGACKRTKTYMCMKQEPDDECPPATSNRGYKRETKDEVKCPPMDTSAETSRNQPTILTFDVDHDKFARLQLLSTHTLYDLVATLCRHTPMGKEGNGPNDHLWNINYRGNKYSRSDNVCSSPLDVNSTKLEDLNLERDSVLTLTYDYGIASNCEITLVEIQDANKEDLSSFPRNKPTDGVPAKYQKYRPRITNHNFLDAQFFHLNDWIFHNATSVTVNLFQAGRKKNYGFCDNKFTMLYLPAKPGTLCNWLECFNRAASIKPAGVERDGYTHYTWHSVVALPRANLTELLRNKYKSNEKPGFCDAPIVEDHNSYPGPSTVDLSKTFPKIAALAGLRKDRRVPKGWISFNRRGRECNLVICKGNAQEQGGPKAPKGLAFEGENQHQSVEEPLFQISSLEIRGLHELFCVVEGLLRTL